MTGLPFIKLFEKMSLRGSYVGGAYQRLVAASYAIAPAQEPEAVKLYTLLAQKIAKQNQQLGKRYDFEHTTEDPYGSMKELTASIRGQERAGIRKPKVKVLASPPLGGHPAINNDTNTMFRGVHDIIAHYFGQHPFSARGEYAAYNRHLKTLPRSVAPILFTEIVGQTSYYKIYGDYTVQKAVFLKDFDYWNIGALAQDSPLNRWFTLQNKVLQPVEGFRWEVFEQEHPQLAEELLKQPKFSPAQWEEYDVAKDASVTRRTKL